VRFVHLDTRDETTDGGGFLARPLTAEYRLDGIEGPLAGTVSLDDVAGFSGAFSLEDIPLHVNASHVPGDRHELVFDQHEHRFGAITGSVTRAAAVPGETNRVKADVARLSSFGAAFALSDGDPVLVEVGRVDDVAQPIPGGLGQVAFSLDEDAAATPNLALAPSLRLELLTVAEDHTLVAATGLRRVRYGRGRHAHGRPSDPGDLILVTIDGRHEPPPTIMTHRPPSGSRFAPYSASLLLHQPPEPGTPPTADPAATPGRRRWVHAGHLDGPVTVEVRPGPPTVIVVDGTLSRVRYEERAGTRTTDAAVPHLAGTVTLTVGEDQADVDTGTPLAVDLSLRAADGLSDDPTSPRELALRGAVPAGTTAYTSGTTDSADTLTVSTSHATGATARVAVGWRLDRLTAVRAVPQVHSTSVVDRRLVAEDETRTASFSDALTARIYGLHRLKVATSDVERASEVAAFLRVVTNTDAEIELYPERPNRALRVVAYGMDTLDSGPPRLHGRMRLSDLSPHVKLVTTHGDEAWQTAMEMRSLHDGVPIAREGSQVGYPGQFPWDGPSGGSFIGIGLSEVMFAELPQRLMLVPLPFEDAAPTDGMAGLIDAGARDVGGQRISVHGTLRLREILTMGWDRSKGDKHAWRRVDAKCLTVVSNDRFEHFWLRQISDRGADLDDDESTLNVIVTGNARVTMDTWIYGTTYPRSEDPKHADDLSGDWKPKARMQYENFNGILKVNADDGSGPAGIDDDDSSGGWYVKSVGAFLGLLDVSLGSNRWSTLDLDASSLGDPCGD
ncbi:MAG: hypothetical protein M3N57_05435, partial [Actinomycetota bacterium]|nr:hypothetical protein [Actinomycetota bacterium]